MRVVGVDPGGRWTGIVHRDGDRLVEAWLLEREDESIAVFAQRVVSRLQRVLCGELLRGGVVARPDVVAVEACRAPKPWMHGRVQFTRPDGIIDTAVVFGAVCTVVPEDRLVVVPPGGHGSGPLTGYPPEMVGGREREGTGKRRHLRSAWDIAAAAGLGRAS